MGQNMNDREARLCQIAARNGFVMEKSPEGGPNSGKQARFRLLVDARDIDAHRASTPFDRTIDEVEEFLLPLDED
jgi:hypothetical protein